MAGLYIHIPFCARRCIYCDFYSTTFGTDVRKRYVEALCHEIAARHDYLPSRELRSVYFGGGTPSQLSGEELESIFLSIFRNFNLAANAEVTLEANPDDLTRDYIMSLHSLPINRISMGVQTFSDPILRLLRRRHTADEAARAVAMCQDAGFENISVDLMYGLPQQSFRLWQHDVDTALNLGVQHISGYALTFEENTPLWAMKTRGEVGEASDDLCLNMYNYLIYATQAHGFRHYEISNFALPGREAVHNSSYWHDIPYLGCGSAAHSYNKTSRQSNDADVLAYIKADGKPHANVETIDARTHYNEMVMTNLRTCDGVDLLKIEKLFGRERLQSLLQVAKPHIDSGDLCLLKNKSNETCAMTLTRKGLFVSDYIISDLMNVD